MQENQMQDFTHEVVASKGGILFAARHSGLYRSQDGGKTWQLAYEGLNIQEPIPTNAVVLSPDFEQDGVVLGGVSGGVLVSKNRGQDWVFARFHEPAPTVTALAVSPGFTNDGLTLAATLEDGVFLSEDGGMSWQAWNFGLLDWNVYCLAVSPDFLNDRMVFIGVETGVYRSTNGGRSWQDLPFPEDAAPVVAIVLSPTFSQDGVIMVDTEEMGRYRSDDGGQTWEPSAEGDSK
jgi:photosystem II stability/assembly factor-like uncharacterized protein